MEINCIIPNISFGKMEESKEFYTNFLELRDIIDMHWFLTLTSPANPTAQLNIVNSDYTFIPNNHLSILIEVSNVDSLYEAAKKINTEIVYAQTHDLWVSKGGFGLKTLKELR